MKYETDVCIVGAGPAGMTLALLLAKVGIRVLVLEHHEDFQREYRGEVLMPRFIQMFRQINLFGFLEKYPHLKLQELEGFYKDQRVLRIGFKDIAPETPFALWMPQPILLGALHDKAKSFPSFQLWFETRAESLTRDGSRVTGVLASRKGEKIEIAAKVTVGTDGRFSAVRKRGSFEIEYENHRFDILWFTIPKPVGYDDRVRFFFSPRRNYLILPKYPDSLQCGLVVQKDEMPKLMKQGVQSVRNILLESHAMFHPFARELKDFSPFNVLQAKIDFVKKWAGDGVLLVGDSAHTCSPAGAIGVSVAVASALVAAGVIRDAVQSGDVSARALGRVQEIRETEVRHIHSRQMAFSRFLLNNSKQSSWMTPVLLFLITKSGLFRALQRDLLVMRKLLPIHPEFVFN